MHQEVLNNIPVYNPFLLINDEINKSKELLQFILLKLSLSPPNYSSMKTIVIDFELNHFHSVEKEILFSCPTIDITGYAKTKEEAVKLIEVVDPALVFIEVNMPKFNAFQILNHTPHFNFETIFVARCATQAIEAIKHQACGFILKPLRIEDILPAIRLAEDRIQAKARDKKPQSRSNGIQQSLFPDNIIGIPTIDGFDFLLIEDIIRCEGFQRCTRIINADGSKILSSYPIGVFKKRLESSHFYATHKSHLINLNHIRKYLKEGTIKMTDNSFVPVSKRRKAEFIKLMTLSR